MCCSQYTAQYMVCVVSNVALHIGQQNTSYINAAVSNGVFCFLQGAASDPDAPEKGLSGASAGCAIGLYFSASKKINKP